MPHIALLESAEKQKYNAGSKARQDVLKIAVDCGYKYINLFRNGGSRAVVALEIVKGCTLAIFKAKKGDKILVQYPYSPMLLNYMMFGALRLGRYFKGYRVSVLIHDLNGLRMNDHVLLRKELKIMKDFNIIYHNESMKDVCEKIYPAKSYQILGLFDYLYSGRRCKRKYCRIPTIMIAGNLSKDKSGYIYAV